MQSFPRPQIRQNQNTYQSSDSILAFPDMNKPFILTCDASKSAIGYILSQIGEKNYGITELECLSVIETV